MHNKRLTRRGGAAALALLLAGAGAKMARADQITSLSFLGQATIPNNAQFEQTPVGGLSGLTFDPANGRYYSVSDDRSDLAPARFYSLDIDLSRGALASNGVQVSGVTTLRGANGSPFAPFSLDPEGIALGPNGSVYVSSEGDRNRGFQPFVNQFSLATGQQISALPIPDKFLIAPGTGVRNNLAFESLTLTTNGAPRLVTATENALLQDGATATPGAGSPSRILTFDATGGAAGAEFLYVTDPSVASPVTGGSADNGLVDLLSLGGDDFLALERGFTQGVGNRIRLYQFSLLGATDIRGIAGLSAYAGPPVQAVRKELLLDLATLNIRLDNIEGLTFGPTLADGSRALVLVSDNNFSQSQITQFVAFGARLAPSAAIPEPGTLALLWGAGASTLGILGRRTRRLRRRGAAG